MTTSLLNDITVAAVPNPLELIEQIGDANDWSYERFGDDEVMMAVTGSYAEYQLRFFWREEVSTLQLACVIEGRVTEAKRPAIFETLALANERLWLGHFEYWSDEASLMFRHAMMLGDCSGTAGDHITTLIETALTECERFYPVFQFVLWAGKSAQEAIEAAMLETMGEA